jgi:ATP-binding protein involved in chromosome partitioning
VSFRTYFEVTGDDRSGLAEQVAAQHRRVEERLRAIARVVAVVSGKGGVGKSYVTAGIAVGAAHRLRGGVGVVDADLKSPTVARMLQATGPLSVDSDGVRPAIGRDEVKVVSTDLLLDEGAPLRWDAPGRERFLWRGILETGALREFLGDVAWGPLDLLLVDLPSDSDRLGDLAELVPTLAGAVVVTIPSEESRRSVERATRCATEAGVRLLGVVENMSGYACAMCGTIGPLFEGHAGSELAEQFGVPLLGQIPWIPPGAHAARHAALDALTERLLAVLP